MDRISHGSRFQVYEDCLRPVGGWHHTPTFNEIEYHEDAELFYFLEGPALMLFVDIKAGKAVMESAQIVRIPPAQS